MASTGRIFRKWRDDAEHAATREIGRQKWYEGLELHVAKVKRA